MFRGVYFTYKSLPMGEQLIFLSTESSRPMPPRPPTQNYCFLAHARARVVAITIAVCRATSEIVIDAIHLILVIVASLFSCFSIFGVSNLRDQSRPYVAPVQALGIISAIQDFIVVGKPIATRLLVNSNFSEALLAI